jgi:hypothetical protein
MHTLDELLLDRINPALGFGFATLTAYPDPNPETDTVDGWVGRSGVDEAFSTIRAGAGVDFNDSTQSLMCYLRNSATANQYNLLRRAIILFKTDSIGTDTITSATLSLNGQGASATIAKSTLAVTSASPASNTALEAADYGTLGTTEYTARLAYDDAVFDAYNHLALTDTAIINKTGITKFGLRLAWDIDNSPPAYKYSNATAHLAFYNVEASGTSKDPYLTVTHAPAATGGNYRRLLGVGM